MRRHFLIWFFLTALYGTHVKAQVTCDSITPVFDVDLSGQPSGVWASTAVVREGYCCSASGSSVCIRFNVLLDSAANGIMFSITSGAMPGGALFYEINCGSPQPVGTPICLNGPGPHIITFCKPGNNVNTYEIRSIPKPNMTNELVVSEACIGELGTIGLIDTSIRWTSVPYNAVHNSFLSCTQGCDSVTVTPTGIVPPYVDYQVSGWVIGGCFPFFYTDTVRVRMVSTLDVSIVPQNPVICYGSAAPTLTASVSGGLPPYSYLWSNGATTASITAPAGTYAVTINDSLNCTLAADSTTVSEFVQPISSYAGNDTLLCSGTAPVQLNGTVTGTTTGTWTGGNGTFNPDRDALNALYTPSAAELAAGQVALYLSNTITLGCPGDTDTLTLAILEEPTPLLNGPDTVCSGNVATYTLTPSGNYTTTWNVSGGIITAQTASSLTVAWQSNSGTVSVTESNQGLCQQTAIMDVVINPLPVSAFTTSTSICAWSTSQAAVIIPQQGWSYAWTLNNVTTTDPQSSAQINLSYSAAGTASLTLTSTDLNGCTDDSTVTIQILPNPQVSISGRDTACAGLPVNYTATPLPGYQYSWNCNGGVLTGNSTSSVSVIWTSNPGSLQLTVTSPNNCDTTFSFPVFIAQQPAPVIQGSQNVCTNDNYTYTASGTADATTIIWQVNGGIITNGQGTSAITVSWLQAGTGDISITTINSNGCDSTIIIPVSILAKPQPALSGPAVTCSNRTVTYTTPYVSGNQYQWSVTGGTITGTSLNTVTVFWGSASGSIVLTESNTLLCDSTVSLTVTVYPRATPIISGLNNSCIKTIQTYIAAGSNPTSSYNWSISGGSVIGSPVNDTIQVAWSNSGSASVSLTETTQYGCDSTTILQVAIAPLPVPQLSGNNSGCQFDTVPYYAPQLQGHVYRVNITNGQLLNTANDTLYVGWTQPGTGIISLTEEYPDGCDSTITLTVQIGQQPSPQVTGPTTICEAESAIYFANTLQGSVINWMVQNGNSQSLPGAGSTSVYFNQPGNALITITETTQLNCVATVRLPVQVMPKPHPVLSGSGTGCIDGTPYRYESNLNSGTHQWSVSGGNYTMLANAIHVNWYTPGLHTIMLTVTDPATGCDSTVTKQVRVDSLARPQVNAGTLAGCAPLTMQFTGNIIQPGNSYNWDFGNNTISHAANPLMVYTVPGSYNVSLIVTNLTGCADTVNSTIQVYPAPVADFTASYNVDALLFNTPALNLSNLSTGASAYTWSFGNGDTSVSFEPGYQYASPGNYDITLTVNNNYGCRDSIRKRIEIKLPELLYIPNAFTPNQDGKNDQWFIKGENIIRFNIAIYNRWGQQIFTSENPQFSWDGYYNGRLAEEGVYVYQLSATGLHGKTFDKAGKITLVR